MGAHLYGMRLFALQLAVMLAAATMISYNVALAAKSPPDVHLSFTRFPTSAPINCSLDGSSGVTDPSVVCAPSSIGAEEAIFSFDDAVISARYQYKKKVQLWSKNDPMHAASFSTSFTIQFQRSSDRIESGNFFSFGGGWAFAITPDQKVGTSGAESFGLFEIDAKTGASLRGKSTQTVAVELDISRGSSSGITFPDPQIPHVGLDINSVKSVVTSPAGDFKTFVDRKLAVFIDYDAPLKRLQVRIQKLTLDGTGANKAKAKLYISYAPFRLADYVAEQSYVGFSSRVPETEDGTYVLYDWKFDTMWVHV